MKRKNSIDSLFKVFNLKIQIMSDIRILHGEKLAQHFDMQNHSNPLEFWKTLYSKIIRSVLPLSSHGKFLLSLNPNTNFCREDV